MLTSFNPRALRGARLIAHRLVGASSYVSIHAPCAGRDAVRIKAAIWQLRFQSTRPARGATSAKASADDDILRFNPRALRGARRVDHRQGYCQQRFQSTRPARGATRSSFSPVLYSECFNPRALRGARLISAVHVET